jgi:hypothetical protein
MKTVKLTENDLMKIVKRVMNEQETESAGGQLSRKNWTLYKKDKMDIVITNQPTGVQHGMYQLTAKDGDGKTINLLFDCRTPDILKIKKDFKAEGKMFSSLENKDLTGELSSKYCRN